MPLNLRPAGALPARFRRPRVLLVGCGDVGLRVAALLGARVQLIALSSSAQRAPLLRSAGLRVLRGDLDRADSLRRLAGLAQRVLHLAPPAAQGSQDRRTRSLVHTLRRGPRPRRLVYGSTSGVYGDCAGAEVAETRRVQPQSARALRRVDAECTLRRYGRDSGVAVQLLRIPGIYAENRANGTPRARLRQGTPVLQAQDDVYTNHIHADDLARACVLALWRGGAQRVYNVCDNSVLKMGDYYDLAADVYGLPRPPRVSRAAMQDSVDALRQSFMQESRRLLNRRMREELGLRLRYPGVRDGLWPSPEGVLSAAASPSCDPALTRATSSSASTQ